MADSCKCGKKANHKGRCRGPLSAETLSKFRKTKFETKQDEVAPIEGNREGNTHA